MNRRVATDRAATARPRSFLLILVLVFLVLASSLLVLTTAGAVQFSRTCRQEHTSILLRQLIDSGRAWVNVHDLSRPGDAAIELDASAVLPPDASGGVTIVANPGTPGTVVMEAHLELHGRSYARTAAFLIAPTEP